MNIYEEQIKQSQQYIPQIKQALLNTYFSDYDKEFLQTDEGNVDIENNVFRRYNHSLRHVVPWLSRQVNLTDKRVLEIGCGTGSSTAALAHYVQWIEGYDIQQLALQGAQRRLQVLGLDNVKLHTITEDTLIPRIECDAKGKYDIILLFAVLEHQTIEERHATIKKCWELLSDNGIMAILDTPNILHYYDLHTSKLPFLHLLPSRLYARYAKNSTRGPFVKSFDREEDMSNSHLDLQIARWGRGVSYHDFELALGGSYKEYIVAEGFEPEIMSWFACTPEEEMLRWYIKNKKFDIPLGFTRCVLNLILKKTPMKSVTSPELRNLPSPPPFSHFTPLPDDLHNRLRNLEMEVQQKTLLIDQIYQSKSWKMGNFFAKNFRRMERLIKRN